MNVPVAIFAKPPVAGRVKTRLAASLGGDLAARLAQALLLDTWEAVARAPGARPVLATPEPGADHGLGRVEAWDQGAGDLGARVERVLARGVAARGACLALGADTAALTPARVQAVVAQLHLHPAALGPSDDGGFWVLGVRQCPPGLLGDLPWSQPHTGEATLRRVQEALGNVALASRGFDVDTLADLVRLVDEADAGRAPEGRAVALGRVVLRRPRAP